MQANTKEKSLESISPLRARKLALIERSKEELKKEQTKTNTGSTGGNGSNKGNAKR